MNDSVKLPDSAHSLPGVAWLLQPSALVELCAGSSVLADARSATTSYLRYKPGVSAVARLDYGAGAGADFVPQVRWVGTYGPDAAPKLYKAQSKVQRRYGDNAQQMITVRELPGHPGHLIAVGYVATDLKLMDVLYEVLGQTAVSLGTGHSPWGVLRFNPQRRVVLTGVGQPKDTVVKISAQQPTVDPAVMRAVAASGAPVQQMVAPSNLPQDRRVQCFPWFGDGDLTAQSDEDVVGQAAYAAGQALAILHASSSGECQVPSAIDPGEKLSVMAADLAPLDAHVAQAFEHVAEMLSPSLCGDDPLVLVHGDFSADQVLVDSTASSYDVHVDGCGAVITDMDRMRHGVVADDLGNAVAAGLMAQLDGAGTQIRVDAVTHSILDGYAAQCARVNRQMPPDTQIRAWAAFHLLLRVMTPWRACDPHWVRKMHQIIELAAVIGQQQLPAELTVGAGNLETRYKMRLKRAWPKTDGRLTAELVDEQGNIRAAVCTPDALLLAAPRWKVNAFGVDAALPGLSQAVAQGTLVVHRRGRRAVVALGDRYIKFVAAAKAPEVAQLSRVLRDVGCAAGFGVPDVVGADDDRVEFSVLSGRSLYQMGLDGDHHGYMAGLRAWSQRWPELVHSDLAPGVLPWYTAEDEVKTLAQWSQRLRAFPGFLSVPDTAWESVVRSVSNQLLELEPAGESGGWVPGVVHRDLHEKQLMIDPDTGEVGLLDFDTAAFGDPALDIANLSVHLQLHRAQGVLGDRTYQAAADVVAALAADLGVSSARFEAYRAATRTRLVCVYAFRPQWSQVVDAWARDVVAEHS